MALGGCVGRQTNGYTWDYRTISPARASDRYMHGPIQNSTPSLLR